MATRARVAIIGEANVMAMAPLVEALIAARAQIAAQRRSRLLQPCPEVPGWMFLHDEYSFVAHDTKLSKRWTKVVNTVRSLGVWPVALNQSQNQTEWGSEHCRQAFASQVIAFRTNSESSSALVPGLLFDPQQLPLKVNAEGETTSEPEPGMAVMSYRAAPVRWDWLPSDDDVRELVAASGPPPPLTAATAFDRFCTQPELHPFEVEAVSSVLGPAVNGRWQVGGFDATHHFPDDDAVESGPVARAAALRAPWGHRATSSTDTAGAAAPARTKIVLSPVQAEVLALIKAGTATTGKLVDAASASKAAVHDALDVLIGCGRVTRVARGRYQAARDRS
ncbi:hypothetical protein [Pseudonocardia sp. ICBG601]|uniref:hypothetical protein n=1 Tax=Pseudonocardia sp. ICBG601 TaxID=2846759 RepID=UPI001CF67491|nr:hypothetical protein [Pseudonocardia sp. ICBG601]